MQDYISTIRNTKITVLNDNHIQNIIQQDSSTIRNQKNPTISETKIPTISETI